MNRTQKAAAALAVMALALALGTPASAQRRGGFGGMFGDGALSPVQLAQIEQVQAELKMTDDQRQQVEVINQDLRDARRDAFQQRQGDQQAQRARRQELTREAEAKLKQVLDETQQKRLQEVWVQIGGPSVLDDPQIVAALKITEQQKQQLEEIAQTSREERRALFQDSQDSTREELRAKMDQQREQTNEKRLAVLTDEQREQFEQMKGQPFEFDRSELFRGGRGGGRGGRGGDNEA